MSGTGTSTTLCADIAVVGGGVAGASMAAVLARDGYDVVLVEREATFRDRVRGECIHPWGVRQIQALGLADALRGAGVHELPLRAHYTEREPGPAIRFDSLGPDVPNEWAIYHPLMQTALLEHAADSGVRVLRPARVTSFTRAPEPRLQVATGTGECEVRARLVIGADGRQSAARRWAGAKVLSGPLHHWVGGCLLEDVALPDDTFATSSLPGGEVLVFPQGGGRARTYIVGNDALVAPLRGHAHIADYTTCCGSVFPEGAFSAARPAGPLAFFPNPDVWADRLYQDRVVLIGDAAGANDPSGGHGLSVCFRDVREIRDQLRAEPDWDIAMHAYAIARDRYYGVLRTFLQWFTALLTDTGPESDARRARAARARELDPDRDGFARLDVTGPDGLVADEAARRNYLGEDLDEALVLA